MSPSPEKTQTQTQTHDSRPALKPLLRRIWAAFLDNRGLAIAILALGVLQAAMTKAPFALIPALESAMTAGPDAPVDLSDDFMVWFDRVSQWIADLVGAGDWERPLRLCLACAVIASVLGVVGAFTIYGTLVLTRYFATKIVVDIRNEVASHMLTLPLRFFGGRRLGELISNITNDTTVLSRSLQLACDHAIVDPLLVLGNMVIIIWFLPQAWWVLLLMIPIMALPLIRMGRKVHKSSSKSLAAMGDATESMNQMLSGMRTVKAFQLEEQRLAEFAGSNANYLKRTVRMLRAKALSQSMVFAAYQAGFAAMLLGAGWLVVRQGYKFGYMMAALAALATTYTHVKRLARAYNILMESTGALERIDAVMDQKSDAGASGEGKVIDSVSGRVAFDSVSFAYGDEPVLRGVSFSVEPGQTVALVGPSGAGKSTATDLIVRFHDPSGGAVLIDGVDLREINLPSFRRHTAMVSQQPFLFNTTLYENIRCGRPDATRAEVEEAARAAQIHDDIVALPAGYDSIAGERGSNLSGGQMQRVTIARAILRDPAILILDEATSALDSEREGEVQRALENLMRGRTSFVIAHRLSTIIDADQILVMEDGRIVESGTHDELVAKDGLYCRLSQLQKLA